MTSGAHDVSRMVGIYKKLFILLASVTALGIILSYLKMPIGLTLFLAFAIMLLKGNIVINSFKHLIAGRNSILIIFLLTVVFFLAVLLLPFLNHEGQIVGTVDISKQIQMQEQPLEVHHGH